MKWFQSTVVQRLLLSFFFIFLTLLFTFPGILHISTNLIGNSGDGYQFVGFQYLAKLQIENGQFPFGHTDYWRYPSGIHYQNLSDAALFVLIGLVFYVFTDNTILVYNLSLLIVLCMNPILCYIALRSLFSRLPSLIGSVMYGLSFYTLIRAQGHVNLVLHSSLIFFIYAILQIYKTQGSKKSFYLFTTSCLLVAFSSLQYILITLGSIFVLIPILIAFFKNECKKFFHILWSKKLYLITSLITIITLFLMFFGHKLYSMIIKEETLPPFGILSIPWISFFVPNPFLTNIIAIWNNGLHPHIEQSIFLGYIEIVLFIIAVIFLPNNKIKVFAIASFILFFMISLGKPSIFSPIWPYQYLFPLFPYRGVGEASRYFIVFYIFFIFVIITFLQHVKSRPLLIAILILVIVERLPYKFPISPSFAKEPFISYVRNSETSAVADLPLYPEYHNGQFYDIFSIHYQKPIINGYFNWLADTYKTRILIKQLGEFRCLKNSKVLSSEELNKEIKHTIELFRKYNIRTVVIHKDLELNEPICRQAKIHIYKLVEDSAVWEKKYSDEKKEVYWMKKKLTKW